MTIEDYTTEKFPIYFVMQDRNPDHHSFAKMAHNILMLYPDIDEKFQRIMIMTNKQKMYFMQRISMLNFPTEDSISWVYCGFKIKILNGELK